MFGGPAHTACLRYCRRQDISLPASVERDNTVEMGPRHCSSGISHSISGRTPTPETHTTTVGALQGLGQKRSTRVRGFFSSGKERDRGSAGLGLSRLLQPSLHRSEEEWQAPPRPRPVGIEPIGTDRKVQDGETRSIRDAIRPGDWAVSIDLQDAYLHVPIRRSSRKFLRFVSEGKCYQFMVLPFGLSTAPRVFTILMEAVAAAARRMGVSLLQYLDDWLLVNQSRHLLLGDLSTLWDLILSLGLIPNLEKSELIPSQNFTYVGMNFLTDHEILRLPEERIASTLVVVFEVLNAPSLTARRLLSLLGTLSAAAGLLPLGRLHLRPLQVYLLFLWRPHVMPLEQMIPLSALFKRHLRWWAQEHRYWEGVPMVVPPPALFLTTDASQSGWGASLDPVGRLFQGIWSPEEVGLHINLLEMRAIYLALVQAVPLVSQRVVMVSTDNTTVVSYLQKQGGTHSVSLCLQTREILLWCQSHGVTIQVRHIPGRLNALADALSRSSKPVLAEWSLERSVCRSILARWGAPWVDLFATRLNSKLPLYVSPAPDPGAWAVDAMSLSWNHLDGYAFPPFIMVPRVLAKVREDGAA